MKKRSESTGQAGAEITLTMEMVKAGARVIEDFEDSKDCVSVSPAHSLEMTARWVFSAMIAAHPLYQRIVEKLAENEPPQISNLNG